MDPNLFLAYLVRRGELTASQRRRIQIKIGAMSQSLDHAMLQTPLLDGGALVRLREEVTHWRTSAEPEEIESLLAGAESGAEMPATSIPGSRTLSFAQSLFVACLEDALAKRMDSILLRFDEFSRPALEILYRYGPHVRDAMAFQEQLAHQFVAEVHELAGTGPLAEEKTTVFHCEIQGVRRALRLRQSERRQGKETLEIRLDA